MLVVFAQTGTPIDYNNVVACAHSYNTLTIAEANSVPTVAPDPNSTTCMDHFWRFNHSGAFMVVGRYAIISLTTKAASVSITTIDLFALCRPHLFSLRSL
jgi:hypothetical protein